jgi:hypothetical protein
LKSDMQLVVKTSCPGKMTVFSHVYLLVNGTRMKQGKHLSY